MRVLVAYSSRHGSTQGIAERISAVLRDKGFDVDLRTAEGVEDLEPYDAYVIGSAAYMGHWLKPAAELVRENEQLLETRPVWLFSSGPIGTERVDKKGQDVLEASRPAEFNEFDAELHPRDEHVFFGAWDPDAPATGIAESFARGFMNLWPSLRQVMPVGDFREWSEIDHWAQGIASELETPVTGG